MGWVRVRLLRRIDSKTYGAREADSTVMMTALDAAQYIADGIAEPLSGATAAEADAAAVELKSLRKRGAKLREAP